MYYRDIYTMYYIHTLRAKIYRTMRSMGNPRLRHFYTKTKLERERCCRHGGSTKTKTNVLLSKHVRLRRAEKRPCQRQTNGRANQSAPRADRGR